MSTDRGKPLFKVGPYEGRKAGDGSFYYAEVGANREDMNVSETYSTKEHAEEGARSALAAAQGSGETLDEALSGSTSPTPEDAVGEVPENEG